MNQFLILLFSLIVIIDQASAGCQLPLTPEPASTAPLTSFLYPGDGPGQLDLPTNDDSSYAVTLQNPIHFFGSSFSNLWVSTNGLLSFTQEYNTYTSSAFPVPNLGRSIIAVYWADVLLSSTSATTYIRYRESTDQSERNRFSCEVANYFGYSWEPLSLFIVTWMNVNYYGANNANHLNTFQMIVGSSAENSFVIYLYPHDKLTWTTGTASGGSASTGLGGTPAQAGFDKGDGRNYYALPGSQTAAILDIDDTSNVGIPGRWAFMISGARVTNPSQILITIEPNPPNNAGPTLVTVQVQERGGAPPARNASGPVIVTLDGNSTTYQVPSNGGLTVNLGTLPLGNYSLNVSYGGSDYYAPVTVIQNVNVEPPPPQPTALTISATRASVMVNKVIGLKVTANLANAPVKIKDQTNTVLTTQNTNAQMIINYNAPAQAVQTVMFYRAATTSSGLESNRAAVTVKSTTGGSTFYSPPDHPTCLGLKINCYVKKPNPTASGTITIWADMTTVIATITVAGEADLPNVDVSAYRLNGLGVQFSGPTPADIGIFFIC